MSFFDCIQTAVNTGKTTPKKGREAQEIYKAKFKENVDKGMSERAADTQAALDTLAETTATKGRQRVRKMAQMRAAHAIYTRGQDAKNLVDDLRDFSDTIDLTARSIFKQAISYMGEMVEASRPRALGLYIPKAHHEAVVRASFGDASNAAAVELWKGISAASEFLRGWANKEGAYIPKADSYLPQHHDRFMMLEEGKEKWVEDHLKPGVLDWEHMRSKYDGKIIPEGKRQEVLERVFDIITTDGAAKKIGRESVPMRESLAEGLSHERFLKYANADAWLDMNKKYGGGDVFQQLTGFMKKMSDDIALMSAFGPDPVANRNFLRNVYDSRAAQIVPDEVPRVRRALDLVDTRYDMQANNIPSADDNVWARARGTIANYVTGTFLGSAFIPQLADAGFAGFAARLYGLPTIRAVMGPITEMLRLTSADRRRFAIQEGLGMESAVSQALGAARYVGPIDGPWLSKRYVDTMMRATLFTPLTQGGQTAWGANLYTAWANHASVSFDDLPFKPLFDAAGITKADWDIMRSKPLKDYNGTPFMSPTDMMKNGNAKEQRIALKFLNAVEYSARRASPFTTTRERAIMLGKSTPGTFHGESLRLSGQFKGFIAATTAVHWQDAMRHDSAWGKVGHLSKLFLWMTVMGVGIVQLQHLAQNLSLEEMDPTKNPTFWLKAMVKGGGMAFVGEIMDTAVRSGQPGGSLADKFTAPVIGLVDDAWQVIGGNLVQALNGEKTNFAKEATNFLAKNAPPGRMWPFRAVWQKAITDELLKATDPAAYRRMIAARRRHLQETGQHELVR